MNKLLINSVLLFAIVVTACRQKQTETTIPVAAPDTVVAEVRYPALETGEVFLKDQNPFGETIELQGENIIADTFIFKVSGTEMLVKGDRLVLKNRPSVSDMGYFALFQYPEMTYLGSYGLSGNGANEFVYPHLVHAVDTTDLCYVFESTYDAISRLDRQGGIVPLEFAFPAGKNKDRWNSKENIVKLGASDFIYAEDSKTGKSIFRTYPENDSIVTKELFSLQLNPKRKSPFAYIGDFGVNAGKKRMVYAYKYFKVLKFIDMETFEVRTLNFQQSGFDDGTLRMADGLDQNVTHYWGMCAQDEYVYCLYSGRTPMEVVREGGKKNYYIYVEQYDWNGNPVCKYKLDHWGYFTVDEKNKRIILASTNDDDPFFFYQMP